MAIEQIYEHRLNPLKGWPNMQVTDQALEANSGVTVVPGMVCHRDPATGKAALGCPAGSVPLFCIVTGNRTIDTDSYREPGEFASATEIDSIGVKKGGAKCSFIVGTYAFEAETTEYDGVTGDFPVDGPVYSPTTGSNAGKLVKAASPATDPVIAVISSKAGVYADAHKTSVIRFNNLPGVARGI